MKTLDRNETAAICGGFEPLNSYQPTGHYGWDVQRMLDQLIREQGPGPFNDQEYAD